MSRGVHARRALAAATLVAVAACRTASVSTGLASDAPEPRRSPALPFRAAATYAEALRLWRSAEDVNAWIGARFEYDPARAMLLAENQRSDGGAVPIARPEDFFVVPRGVCVDLSRFAVETLRVIAPETQPAFLMIEFEPTTVAGNTLRRHWLAAYREGERHYFFADSKRPGHIAGPYASPDEFIHEYEAYRGRKVFAFRELESYERKARTRAVQSPREERE